MKQRSRLMAAVGAILIVLALVVTGRTKGSGGDDEPLRIKTGQNAVTEPATKRVAPATEETEAAWVSAMNAEPDRAHAIAAENGIDWCQTQVVYARRYPNDARIIIICNC